MYRNAFREPIVLLQSVAYVRLTLLAAYGWLIRWDTIRTQKKKTKQQNDKPSKNRRVYIGDEAKHSKQLCAADGSDDGHGCNFIDESWSKI